MNQGGIKTRRGTGASFGRGRRCEHAHIAVKERLEQAGRHPLRILKRSRCAALRALGRAPAPLLPRAGPCNGQMLLTRRILLYKTCNNCELT
jgi:hypothetical protein